MHITIFHKNTFDKVTERWYNEMLFKFKAVMLTLTKLISSIDMM